MSNPFGPKCKDVTAALDLGTLSPARRVRVTAHLLLCRACLRYFHISGFLAATARQAFAGEAARGDLERLNEELLKKHGR